MIDQAKLDAAFHASLRRVNVARRLPKLLCMFATTIGSATG